MEGASRILHEVGNFAPKNFEGDRTTLSLELNQLFAFVNYDAGRETVLFKVFDFHEYKSGGTISSELIIRQARNWYPIWSITRNCFSAPPPLSNSMHYGRVNQDISDKKGRRFHIWAVTQYLFFFFFSETKSRDKSGIDWKKKYSDCPSI